MKTPKNNQNVILARELGADMAEDLYEAIKMLALDVVPEEDRDMDEAMFEFLKAAKRGFNSALKGR